jgi:KUP system potassium uptake protein
MGLWRGGANFGAERSSRQMNSLDTRKKGLASLALGAMGVVYGDIGTSPLYAVKETFHGAHRLEPDELHVLGTLSLIFWSVMLVVSAKYVAVIMRADNRGEGGSLALLALTSRLTQGSALSGLVVILGIFAAALFYGDSMITPAISVLSAVEGLKVVAPGLDPYVVPVTLGVLLALFALQSHGTARVGYLFGPIMLIWFATLATIGLVWIVRAPVVLTAINPFHALQFFIIDKWVAFLALGSVVLAVTGAEALYADMGHFGRLPIRTAWFGLVLPSLMLNYFGQGAMILIDPLAVDNPFYRMVPEWATLPMVILATAATVIASQAVISGAFSVTRQAIQLGYVPRMEIIHTSASEMGQIFLPFVNWTLAILVAALVLGFRSSSNLASAYGIAVTGTMIIDLALVTIVIVMAWRWRPWIAALVVGVFFIVDFAYFAANLTKVTHGGWFPLVMGLVIFAMLTTWKRGRVLLIERTRRDTIDLKTFLEALSSRVHRVVGTAVFLTATPDNAPSALLHNLKHNKVLHERVIVLSVRYEEDAIIPSGERYELTLLPQKFYRLVLHYGFMEEANIPEAIAACPGLDFEPDPMMISYFLSRQTVVPSAAPGMAIWREHLFAWMSRSSTTAMDFFHIPTNRVVELGSQIEI